MAGDNEGATVHVIEQVGKRVAVVGLDLAVGAGELLGRVAELGKLIRESRGRAVGEVA